MKRLVVFDSQFGNTEIIARALAESIKAKAVKVSEIETDDLTGMEVPVAGSPTQGGRATTAIQSWLNGISADEAARSNHRVCGSGGIYIDGYYFGPELSWVQFYISGHQRTVGHRRSHQNCLERHDFCF